MTSYANYDAYIGTGDYTSPTPEQTVTYMYDVFNRWIGETVTITTRRQSTSVHTTARLRRQPDRFTVRQGRAPAP